MKVKYFGSALIGFSLSLGILALLLIGIDVQGKEIETATETATETTYTLNQLYSMSGVVISIEQTETEYQLITFKCYNGNLFSFYSDADDWYVNDIASCIMCNNGTEIVYDDHVLQAKNVGFGWQLQD